MKTRTVSNNNDVIDSRDVIKRIKELEQWRDDAQEAADGDKETMEDGTELHTSSDFTEDEYLELKALLALQEEAKDCTDWKHGETLIRDDYFKRYAQDLADDLGYIKDTNHWPYTCIDWEKAASELQQDYTSVDYDGVTYWVRS